MKIANTSARGERDGSIRCPPKTFYVYHDTSRITTVMRMREEKDAVPGKSIFLNSNTFTILFVRMSKVQNITIL
jgi:hypothetical protein